MAIVQISQITNRKGLAVDLPQLAGAELGWSTDTRQLWIGNGTLAEGAPVVGNTEILTEFSDIINIGAAYTYKGTAAGYIVQTGPTPGSPIVQSLQSWMDQYASVKDFGAVGDGTTDDTAAINRALFQLYCRQANPQIRRSLFFPAGVYKVSATINIPTYATLIGEGADSSIIRLVDGSGAVQQVAQTADSLQQTGVNIGSGGATPPTEITIANLAFQNLDPDTDVFLLESTTNSRFQNVSFIGPLTASDITTDAAATHGLVLSSQVQVSSSTVFQGCLFTGTIWGINTNDQTKGIVVDNSSFNTLYSGVILGQGSVINGGASGTRITNNTFDNIFAEGVIFGSVALNATGYNIFYDVGNELQGLTNPTYSVISIEGNNNVSIGDMFERTDAYTTIYPRIDLNGTQSIATTNGSQLSLGDYTRKSGVRATLLDNQSSAQTIFTVSPLLTRAFTINYTMIRSEGYRTGSFTVTSMGTSTTAQSMDDYVENEVLGVILSVTQSAEGSNMSVQYTSTPAGATTEMTYSITYLA